VGALLGQRPRRPGGVGRRHGGAIGDDRARAHTVQNAVRASVTRSLMAVSPTHRKMISAAATRIELEAQRNDTGIPGTRIMGYPMAA